jgi:hypothetical protein
MPPGTTPLPMDHIRVECAFTTTPDDPAPAWTDITAFAELSSGVSITGGRGDEYAAVQAGTCRVGLDNTDGRFTPGNTAGAYYPDVKVRKKLRVSYRDPAVPGNMVDAESASFEGGTVGAWVNNYFGGTASTIANSVVRAHDGTKSLLVTWPTTGALGSAAQWSVSLIIGRQYTFGVWVYVPTGSPAVIFKELFGYSTTATSTVFDAWQQLTITFTASRTAYYFGVENNAAATAGQQAWVDSFQGDEGATLPAFNTTALPIRYRFTGYVEEWPTEWPGGNAYSTAMVTATDQFKRLGQAVKLKSIIEQEYLADDPAVYYTLGDPTGATTAGDTSKNNAGKLSTLQVGAGGALTFGANTGPGTDSMPAPAFAPVNVTNGQYLSGTLTPSVGFSGLTMEAFMLTSAAVQQTVVRLVDTNGSWIEVSTTATGKVSATDLNVFTGLVNFKVTSASSFNDGATHHVALTQSIAAGSPVGTVTNTLVVDGVSVGSATYSGSYISSYVKSNVGGVAAGALFTGTIAHVAASSSAVSVSRLLSHYQSGSTGFAGERSDQRIARLARYAGVLTAEQSLDAGFSTSITFVDTTGAAPLRAMQDVTATEGGVLFIDGQGRLAFQSRGHRYNTISTFTATARDVDPGARFISNDALLVNDVTAGRAGGATVRAVNAGSVADYGTASVNLTLLTTSDAEVADAANWKANAGSAINPRLPNLTLDLLTSPNLTAAALLLGLGSRITVSGLPSQAPASSMDLFIEGWTETISAGGWVIAWNTSPVAASSVWQLDSPIYSQLDVSTRLAY